MLKIKSKAFAGLMVALILSIGAVSIASADVINLPSTGVKKTSGATVIKNLQTFLNWSLGSQIVPLVIDGKWGAKTTAAIKAYQGANSLVADGLFGKLSAAKAAAIQANGGSTPPPPVITNGMITASFANAPAAGNVLAGSAIADLAHFTFSNGTSSSVNVTNVKLTRTGYSADTDLVNVFLYNGNIRVTDSASVSSGVITFNDSTGLFAIPANGSITIAVKADIVAGFAGTAGVTLTSYTAGGLANTVSLAGNTMYGITTTLTTVQFGNVAVAPTATTTDPTVDYVVWRKSDIQIGTHDVSMKSLRLRQIGSVQSGDIQNFRLYVDGVQAGPTVASLSSDGYLTFDLSAAPVTLKSGNRDLKVVADIVGGSNRTFSFSLRTASDLNAVDAQVGANILATGNLTSSTASFASMSSVSATINPGALTMAKSTDSPTSTVVLGGSNILLGKWDVKATGEQMKVENLYVRVIPSVAGTTTLRNGAFYFNGVQIGSTTSVSTAAAGTQYTFGSSFVVDPGVTGILEFRADNYAATGTTIVAGDTFQAEICNAACNAAQTGSNVQRKVSLTYGSYPTAISTANVLTATVGTFSMAKDQSYANQTIVVPKTAQLLGQFTLTSGSSDTVNADTITARLVDNTDASTVITNLYVTYGAKTSSMKSSITTAVAAANSDNTWSIGETISANTTMTFKVYGDVSSSATPGSTITTSLLVSGTSSNGTAVTTGATPIAGQVTTPQSSGVLTVSLDAATPVASQVVAGTTDQAGILRIKLSGTNEDIYVKKIVLGVSATTTAAAVTASASISSIDLQMSTTSTGTFTTVGTAQTILNDGTIPGNVTWNLSGSGRILVARNSSVYLKAVPTYVPSGGSSTVSGKTPKLSLWDLQAEGTSAMSAGLATLTNTTGIVVQANSSAAYVAAGETHTAAIISATATNIPTANSVVFAPGDVIFIDGNASSTWNSASEELMTVVGDDGINLTVRRGTYGTTAYAYDVDTDPIYRLSGIVATYPNASIIGNQMTVLNTKLGLALSSQSPSGSNSGGTGKIVFAFTASAANNPADPATNTATLNYVDITTTKSSGNTTLNTLTLYPSEYDTNATYATVCGAVSTSKWRCNLSSAGNTNQIDENTSRTYIVRGDTAYAAYGTIDIGVAALGTSSLSTSLNTPTTNSVLWADGTTSQNWVNQGSTYVQNASPLTSATISGTYDQTAPTLAVAFGNKSGGTANSIEPGDTVTITYSEPIDASTVNASLVPGGAVTGVLAAATGGFNATTGCVITITGITTADCGTSIAEAIAHTVNLALDAAGKVLTITIGAITTGTGDHVITTPALVAGAQIAGVKDANNVNSGTPAVTPTGAF
jgi:hypothetical protein